MAEAGAAPSRQMMPGFSRLHGRPGLMMMLVACLWVGVVFGSYAFVYFRQIWPKLVSLVGS